MRYKDLTPYEVTLYLEEERAHDEAAVARVDESIGYLALWTTIRVDDTNGTTPTDPEENVHKIQ
jgi:hypothetical protein